MTMLARAKGALEIGSYLLTCVAAAVLLWSLLAPPSLNKEQPRRDKAQDVSGVRIDTTRLSNIRGGGKIAILEFSDFECPYCAMYARVAFPVLAREMIDKGEVRYAVMQFPLDRIHPLANKAGRAAECAGQQGRYWEMHERLFAISPALGQERLDNEARALALNMTDFQRCVETEAAERVKADVAEGVRLGVTGTPAFFFGVVNDDKSIDVKRRVTGFASFEEVKKEILALANASAGIERTFFPMRRESKLETKPTVNAAASGGLR